MSNREIRNLNYRAGSAAPSFLLIVVVSAAAAAAADIDSILFIY